MQLLFSAVYLWRCLQILNELDTEVHDDLSEGALSFNEPLKVLVHVLPLGVLLFRLLLEVGEEVTLLLFFVTLIPQHYNLTLFISS